MKKERGITLIALIITIIIMLILVGVTVSVALNGGLFKTAKDAVTGTDKARIEEEMTSVVLGFVNENLLADADIESLKTAVSKIKGITSVEGEVFPLTVKDENNNQWTIEEDGTIEPLGEWYSLTSREIEELAQYDNSGKYSGGRIIADNSDGSLIVATVENQDGKIVGIILIAGEETGYYSFMDSDILEKEFGIEDKAENFKWYILDFDSKSLVEIEENASIIKDEFENIYCESYLDRIIENIAL